MTSRSDPEHDAASLVDDPSDRRVAPRIRAEDVPWIVTVKLGPGHSGRLVDISRTGMLLETSERLHPGHKRVMTLALADNRSESIPAQVLRSHLVALSKDGKPIYQAAILFAKELDSELLTPIQQLLDVDDSADAGPTHQPADQLDGPFDALWATSHGSVLTRATGLSETSCIVHLPTPGVTGTLATVTIIFTPFRRLLLTGRIVDALPDGVCVMRFEGLNPEQRRALRVELRSYGAESTSQTPSLHAPSVTSTANTISPPTIYLTDLQASNW